MLHEHADLDNKLRMLFVAQSGNARPGKGSIVVVEDSTLDDSAIRLRS